MNSKIKIFVLCPLPWDTRPINEYIQIKENKWMNWISWKAQAYENQLKRNTIMCFFIISLLQWPIQWPNSISLNSAIIWIIQTFETSLYLAIIMLILLSFFWTTMNSRFNESRLFYEESSWFDSQVWDKPYFLIKNDQLISTQKIQPILTRFYRTITIFFFITLFFTFLI